MNLPLPAHIYIDAHWDTHLARTREFLCQPSISAQNNGMRATAAMLTQWLTERGAQVQHFGRESHPIIYAEWNVGAPKTLLVYGMYDVQPVDDQVWTTPPFAAEIWNHPGGGESIVARGACNSKGPLMAFLHAVEALRASGGLPVNIKWTIEGEEEIGSLALPDFYKQNRELLKADAAFEAFWSQWETGGAPQVTLGTKGVLGVEFVCRSGAWGGPASVTHSSMGAWLGNPAWRLMQALSTLVNEHQQLIVEGIPGLGEMAEGDEELLRQQAADFNLAEAMKRTGTTRFKRTEWSAYEALKEIAFAPVLNINGLKSGYLGEGSHTILPTEARANCDLRMAPGMEVEATHRALQAHLAQRGFGDIEVRVDSGYPAARSPLSAPVVQALIAAYRAHGHEPHVRPIEASATPYYLYTDVLGMTFAWGGLGTAGGSHGPDEWCLVQGLKDLEKSVATFLTAFAVNG